MGRLQDHPTRGACDLTVDYKRPPFTVVPRATSQALFREASVRAHETFQGQQAGTPGMGEPPILVHEAGGDTVSGLLHPAFTVLERLYRTLPEGGWFSPSVSPASPVQFQMGSFTVPPNLTLWLTDYEFSVYRPSGIDPGDFLRAAEGRYSNVMGFDITIGGQRLSNLSYQLDPAPVTLSRQAFEPPPGARAVQAQFDRASVNSFASTASPGTSLLPPWDKTQGPRGGPFTFVVGQGGQVNLNCVIFNTIPSPIAAVQGRCAGYLINENVSDSLLNRVRPR